jgi:DNA/RNA endonuclease YhcR with UshA esterase domain
MAREFDVSSLAENGAAHGTSTVINPVDAKNYEGKKITVEFEVAASRTLTGRDIAYLNSMEDFDDPKCFTAYIGTNAFAKFKSSAKIDDPAAHFRKKRIRVTGTVKQFRGKTEIEIDSPDQITVVDSAKNAAR